MWLWGIFCVINSLPDILLDLIGWVFSPFTELRNSGIFEIFDASLGKLVGMSSTGRVPTFGDACMDFVLKGSMFLANTAGMSDADKQKLVEAHDKNVKNPHKNKAVQPKTHTKSRGQRADEQTQLVRNDSHQKCLEENLVAITDKMSDSDRTLAETMNQNAQMKCKLQQVQESISALSARF
jgi:hypothetical protein